MFKKGNIHHQAYTAGTNTNRHYYCLFLNMTKVWFHEYITNGDSMAYVYNANLLISGTHFLSSKLPNLKKETINVFTLPIIKHQIPHILLNQRNVTLSNTAKSGVITAIKKYWWETVPHRPLKLTYSSCAESLPQSSLLGRILYHPSPSTKEQRSYHGIIPTMFVPLLRCFLQGILTLEDARSYSI